jgi:aspartyl protease family protein
MGVAVVVFAGFSYRFELSQIKDRLMGELIPSSEIEVSGGAVSIRANQSGHYVVEAMVAVGKHDGGGQPIRFLVDTGASDVVLSPRDAERLGFKLSDLEYTRAYRTANGMVNGAPVRLNRVSIGPLSLGEVRASVNGAPMKNSLLGMSFLSRLSGYEVSRERMVLHP